MDEFKLIELLQLQAGSLPERSPFCPDDERLTRYFEGGLDGSQRAALKHHLVECRYCLARVGILDRLDGNGESRSLPGEVLAEAKSLVPPPPLQRSRLPAAAVAAAAIVVLAVFSIGLLRPGKDSKQGIPALDFYVAAEKARQVRNEAPAEIRPEIVTPMDGQTVYLDDLTIKWAGIRGSLYYDVQILDTEGFIIQSGRIEGANDWRPPVSHLLKSGNSYYVRVDAHLADARKLSSNHVLFNLAGRLP